MIEDAIATEGNIPPEETGVYFRIIWRHGMSDSELREYEKFVYRLSQESPIESRYPEWVLQELDQRWMTGFPSLQESGYYKVNTRYVRNLINKLGENKGRELERLADYCLSCIPGFRTKRRQLTYSTDHDIVCSVDGSALDFRDEFGRYFVCECKDWNRTADFSSFAKFCRVLDSVRARFGILFSKNGISGEGGFIVDEKENSSELNQDKNGREPVNAKREQLKVYHDRNIIIIVIDKEDFHKIEKGENLITLLRQKYEIVRLDLKDQN
jgi:hypothetical protein